MKRLLVMLASLVLVLGLALPTMASTLKISGEYIFEANYEDGELGVLNPDGKDNDKDGYTDVDLTSNFLDFSTLKLTLDFGEGDSLMVAHVPLSLSVGNSDVADEGAEVNVSLDDNYYFAFNGDPLKLSLTDIGAKEDSPYAFQSFGDPLGLVKTLDATTTLKAVGSVAGVGVTGYVIDYVADDDKETLDKNEAADIEYELLRLTYGLPGGYTLGGIYAIKASAINPVDPTDPTRLQYDAASELAGKDETLTRNLALDLAGPLPVSEGAKLTAAAAQSQEKQTGDEKWGDGQNAFKLSLSDIKLGAFTVAADVRAVDKDFAAVAPEEEDDDVGVSDVVDYAGQKQFKVSVSTPLDIGGREVTLKVSDEYRTNFDKNEAKIDPWNEAKAEAGFDVAQDLTATVGGSYKAWLERANIAERNVPGYDGDPGYDENDYSHSVFGKLEYKPMEILTVTGEVRHTGAEKLTVEGSGVKLSGSVEAAPIPGVTAKADVEYGTGRYDFFADTPQPVSDKLTRTKGSAYVEAKQSFQPGTVKGVDVVLASGAELDSETEPYLVGYGETKVNVDDRVSAKAALLYGMTEDHGDPGADPMKIVYTGVDYKVSPNSTLSLAYSNRNEVGNIYAAYAVKLGVSTMTVSYGEDRLDDPCDGDYDADKPWAWLCTIGGKATRDNFYTLKISIPF